MTFRWPAVVVACLIAATLIKLTFAYKTIGSNDVLFYRAYWIKSVEPGGGVELYRDGIKLHDSRGVPYRHENYANPPFVIHLLRVCGWLARVTVLEFPFWLRVPAILADIGIVLLLWGLLRPATQTAWLALAFVAASPVSILVSGFHGSTDSVVVFFLMLAVWIYQRTGNPMLAGIAFGMSVNMKVWPGMFVPAILAFLPTWHQRFRFTVAAGITFLFGSMPFLLMEPELVLRRVFGYPSVYGNWGLSRLFSYISQLIGFPALSNWFEAAGRFIVLGAVAWLGIWLQRRAPRTPLAVRIGLISGLFLSITPGFGVQYLAWVAPWGILAGAEALALFGFSGGVFLYSVYNYWSNGTWQEANSLIVAPWPGTTIFYELLCWASVILLAHSIWSTVPRSIPALDDVRPEPLPTPKKPVKRKSK